MIHLQCCVRCESEPQLLKLNYTSNRYGCQAFIRQLNDLCDCLPITTIFIILSTDLTQVLCLSFFPIHIN
jgi:hypothetical protein